MHLSEKLTLPNGIKQYQVTHFAASAIILNAQKMLLMLMRDDYPGWTQIGGNVDPGETLEVAMRREVKEEAGIEITITAPPVDFIAPTPNSDPVQYKFERVYICHPRDDDQIEQLGNEGVRLEWLDPAKLPDNTHIRQRFRIERTLAGPQPQILFMPSLPMGKEYTHTLSPQQIYGLDVWLNHPRTKVDEKQFWLDRLKAVKTHTPRPADLWAQINCF